MRININICTFTFRSNEFVLYRQSNGEINYSYNVNINNNYTYVLYLCVVVFLENLTAKGSHTFRIGGI